MSGNSCRLSASANPDSNHFIRERNLIQLLTMFIASGIFFMVVPGTLLGVWNLIEIGTHRTQSAAATLWIQAHGHAQLFGWLGTFVLGIGYYCIPNLRKLCPSSFASGWLILMLWVTGVALRWIAAISSFAWKILFPASAVLELFAVGIFVWLSICGSKTSKSSRKSMEAYALLLITGSLVWFILMIANLAVLWNLTCTASMPVLPAETGRKLLFAAVWGWMVPTVWGLSAKWLPAFLGLANSDARLLKLSCVLNLTAVLLYSFGASLPAQWLVFISSLSFVSALKIFRNAPGSAKIQGVHPSFPRFVKGAYAWLIFSAFLFFCSGIFPAAEGTSGAARHAITVGFFSTMVFSMGPRVLPAFLGRKKIFNELLMFIALLLLSAGCFARVSSEICAYDFSMAFCWLLLPVSAVIELSAIMLFAFNILASFRQKPFVDEILDLHSAQHTV